jgi:uncharacterized protein YjbI with pentapeptide repeats
LDRDEAIRLLKRGEEGVKAWNQRRNSGEELPELIGADLSGANLIEADLSGANLIGANLIGANLIGANLSGANLDKANFNGANLIGANLGGANLSGADLGGTNLSWAEFIGANLAEADLRVATLSWAKLIRAKLIRANLSRADLTRADLTGANLSEARCYYTAFNNVNLATVRGLDNVYHLGPSTVGVDTLIKSQGRIPDSFLLACGVPERWIEFLPSSIGMLEPNHYYSCFMSYSTKDEKFASRLYSRLRDEKLRVWYSPEEIKGGRTLEEQIGQAIRVHDKLLLVLSKASMASPWVKHEIRQALIWEKEDKRRVLFPIRVCPWKPVKEWKCFDAENGQDLAEIVRKYFIRDFSKWRDKDAFETAFSRLLKDLKADETTPAESSVKAGKGRKSRKA